MNNRILGSVSVSLALLLAACGQSSPVDGTPSPGGNGGGGQTIAPVARSAAALGSKEDALLQLRVSSLVAEQVSGGNINISGGKKRQQPLGWGFGYGERVNGANSVGDHSFTLFQGALPAVGRSLTTHSKAANKWTTADGSTETVTLNGVTEHGQSADQTASYQLHGSDTAAYSETRERRSSGGALLASDSLQLQGLSEVNWPTGGTLDARGLLKYRYQNSDGTKFNADIGETGTPFRVRQSKELSLDGTYAYELAGQSAGLATVSTLEPIQFDSTGSHPAAGVLRIVSGNSTATFTFRQDGGAALQLNDAQQDVSASEVRSALLDS